MTESSMYLTFFTPLFISKGFKKQVNLEHQMLYILVSWPFPLSHAKRKCRNICTKRGKEKRSGSWKVCYLQNFWLRSLFLPAKKPTLVVRAQDSMTDDQLILFCRNILYWVHVCLDLSFILFIIDAASLDLTILMQQKMINRMARDTRNWQAQSAALTIFSQHLTRTKYPKNIRNSGTKMW